MNFKFTRMHGLENQFVVIDQNENVELTSETAKEICEALGADQILRLKEEPEVDVLMEVWNRDGSQVEMCGNGLRAVGKYLNEHGPNPGKSEYEILTGAGKKMVQIDGDSYTVDMGPPRFVGTVEIDLEGKKWKFNRLDFGNPHAVTFMDDLDRESVLHFGPLFENHKIFKPEKTNVAFVKILAPNEVEALIWERGAGLTQACGSGACAAAAAAIQFGNCHFDVAVNLPGGRLEMKWNDQGSSMLMTGPAVELSQGEWPLK